MNNLKTINKSIEHLFNQSKKLNNEDFDKFLFNIELIRKSIIKKRQVSKSKLFEKRITFRDYINS